MARRQAITWTNVIILLIGPLGTKFSEIFFIKIHTFSFKKMHLKTSSAKRPPFCLGLDVSTQTQCSFSQPRFLTGCTYSSNKSRLFQTYRDRLDMFSQKHDIERQASLPMMTSSNGNIFRVTGPLRGEFTGPQWIPRTKASDAELWCFYWSAPE